MPFLILCETKSNAGSPFTLFFDPLQTAENRSAGPPVHVSIHPRYVSGFPIASYVIACQLNEVGKFCVSQMQLLNYRE